ncbi:MAG: 23S rRNA (pseudouridine(1915)-N(3))-methyltransferase RlmH [Bacteroidales bacterium]|nr:23S rRNA (pseudouridine(1915)-N(3))-methyltransferase RlmH [Bacteroidales bacterium]
MKIKLTYIGKPDGDLFQSAIDDYVKKVRFYIGYELVSIPYIKNCKSLSFSEQKEKEGEQFLKKIEPGDFVVLLDEHGKEMTSMQFSAQLQQYMNNGTKTLVFLIGGAYGFSEAVYQRANAKISLSKMTFPHIMTRLIFTEQLYRAFTILKGEPYHHE